MSLFLQESYTPFLPGIRQILMSNSPVLGLRSLSNPINNNLCLIKLPLSKAPGVRQFKHRCQFSSWYMGMEDLAFIGPVYRLYALPKTLYDILTCFVTF